MPDDSDTLTLDEDTQEAITRGKHMAEKGDLRKAIRAFAKAQLLVPAEYLVKCGDINVLRGEYKSAFDCYRLAESQPKLRELHRHLKDSGYDSLAERVSMHIVLLEKA